MDRWRNAAAMLARRWQIPVAICALVAVGLALHRVRPPKRDVPFEALLADVLALAEGGAYFDAADAAANLLELDPPLPVTQQAVLHDTLAGIIHRQELLRGLPNRRNAELLLEHHEAALACGHRADATAALRAGQAHEWLGHAQEAVKAYRTVLERVATGDTRRRALQGLVRLLDGQPRAEEQRRGYIQALLDEEGISPAYLWWALRQAIQEALDHEEVTRARELLTRHGERLKRSDLKGYYDYLWAWAYVHEGQTELAEPLLDRVAPWLAKHARADPQMDQAGFLPAMIRWLRGRIHLTEARPQAALQSFDEALALQSHGELLLVATIGRTQALAMLERHQAARQAVRDAVARLEGDATTLSVALPRLRHALTELFRGRDERQDYENAVGYLELALELTAEDESDVRLDFLERLGRENERAAEFASTPEDRRRLHTAAARYYQQAAELARFDAPRYASLLWASAAQFDHADRMKDARLLLLRFVEGRSLDPRLPQALLQLGRAEAADGRLHEAVEHYRRLTRDYPQLEEASRARLLTAECLAALGAEHYGEAEVILCDLLEDDDVAPQAQVFRDTLFGLCDLLYQQARYGQAIGRMEDFLGFYPEDPQRYRVRFMLADAYRRSAYALRNDETAGPLAARRHVSRERFHQAAKLFEALASDVQGAPIDNPTRASYERLALLYRGDCLFELNEPATLEEALAIYRQAAARYQGEPAALTAQVQIANVYLRQGELTQAARAVERARWLLGNIPDRVFAEYEDGLDRESWDRLLSSVRSSYLLRHVFAETQ